MCKETSMRILQIHFNPDGSKVIFYIEDGEYKSKHLPVGDQGDQPDMIHYSNIFDYLRKK